MGDKVGNQSETYCGVIKVSPQLSSPIHYASFSLRLSQNHLPLGQSVDDKVGRGKGGVGRNFLEEVDINVDIPSLSALRGLRQFVAEHNSFGSHILDFKS